MSVRVLDCDTERLRREKTPVVPPRSGPGRNDKKAINITRTGENIYKKTSPLKFGVLNETPYIHTRLYPYTCRMLAYLYGSVHCATYTHAHCFPMALCSPPLYCYSHLSRSSVASGFFSVSFSLTLSLPLPLSLSLSHSLNLSLSHSFSLHLYPSLSHAHPL